MFITTMLSFGLEQVIVRRISVSRTSDWAASAYLLHTFIGSVIVLAILFIIRFFWGNVAVINYLPFFFIAQCLIYIGTPLKQYLNAKEKFAPYGVIALISNTGKLGVMFILLHLGRLTFGNILLILTSFALFELICLLVYIRQSALFSLDFRLRFSAYTKLLKEAAPQYLAVVFDSSLSRMDWILLGIISTTPAVADYSFAYRAFEISRLPLSVIAPVLLPRFSRMLAKGNTFDDRKKTFLRHMFSIEMFFAVLLILCMNVLWVPLVTHITHGKYGESNRMQFFILSLCVPLHFFINMLWTIAFAGRKYRQVSAVTIIAAISNVVLNLVLIPVWGGLGAAIAFLITTLIQAGAYYLLIRRQFLSFPVAALAAFIIIAAVLYFVTYHFIAAIFLRIFAAFAAYIILCLLLRVINKQHFLSIKELLSQ